MKHTKEEILIALKVIKDTCEESHCKYNECPFSTDDYVCGINEREPEDWDTIDTVPPVWKAFK